MRTVHSYKEHGGVEKGRGGEGEGRKKGKRRWRGGGGGSLFTKSTHEGVAGRYGVWKREGGGVEGGGGGGEEGERKEEGLYIDKK